MRKRGQGRAKAEKSEKTRPAKKPRVAFLGLGAMGAPMAARLARAGFPLAVWNRSPGRAAPLAALGARVAASPADAARDADVIVTMLSDAKALDAVIAGKHGVASALAKGALVIEMSTAGRASARRAAKLVTKARGRFVDAPVSGTVGPAERGELLAMAGGEARDVKDAEAVLSAMCRRVIHAGSVGQGQALKVLLNGIGAHHFVAFASMLVLGEKAGLAREVLVDAFTSGAFASPSYIGKRGKVLARDYAPEFSLALTLKDARLNLELQDEVKLALPVVRAIAREIRGAVDAGLGGIDLYGIERWFSGAARSKRRRPKPRAR